MVVRTASIPFTFAEFRTCRIGHANKHLVDNQACFLFHYTPAQHALSMACEIDKLGTKLARIN